MIQFGSLNGFFNPFYGCNSIINTGKTMELIKTNKRPHGIGGSDIAALLGLSPYKSPLELWAEKVGHPGIKESQGIHLRFGQHVEPFIAKEYERSTGLVTHVHPETIIHPIHGFMYGHIDRFVTPTKPSPLSDVDILKTDTLLECKSASVYNRDQWGEPGTEQVPSNYLLQCAWYMAITGCNKADIAVLLGNQDFRVYRITRDTELENMLIDQAKKFWEEYVKPCVAPPAQNVNDLRILYPYDKPGEKAEACQELYVAHQKYHKLSAELTHISDELEAIKSHIMKAMGPAQELIYEGKILATWKNTKPANRLDTQALKACHPEVAEKFMVEGVISRRFCIKESV
jgi:putative phage-type endonuclease